MTGDPPPLLRRAVRGLRRRGRRAIWRYQAWKLPSTRLLRIFGQQRPDATFVQVGSNDGEQLDPLRQSILEREWRGLMIEPVPHVFARLRENYAEVSDRVALANVAIADADGVLPFHHLAQVADHEAEGLPRWYDALGSFRRDIVLKHVDRIPDIESRLVTTPVECTTLTSLCEQHDIESIDLLHIDTEGYDFEILKTVDWDRFRPAMVIYEHLHLDDGDRAAARTFLTTRGYGCLQEHMDTWCVDMRADDPELRPLRERFRRFADVSDVELAGE